MLERGQIINGLYEVCEPIGEGGAGEVFRAWHIRLQKDVVIKRIKSHYVGRIEERREADILKNLKHRYLPQVYDYIQMDTEVYTVMDFIDGNTLMDYIKEGVRFDEPQMVKWTHELLEALDYLHAQKPSIIHSDIKPANIMIDSEGTICLIDFNISFDENDMRKLSGYSAGYASPEQLHKAQLFSTGGRYLDVQIDARSDIFSLGASLYHSMTLKNPVKLMEAGEDLWKEPLPYSEQFINVIRKALKRNPDERYSSAALMLRDLDTMKLRDREYKKLRLTQSLFTLFCIVLLVTGVLMTYRGMIHRKSEEFTASYQSVVREMEEANYEEVVDDAFSILNNEKYRSELENNPEQEANLLYMIANCYFEESEYQQSWEYYSSAIEAFDSNPDFYRDYAIALARGGEVEDAEKTAQEGVDVGLKDDGLSLVNAEIALKEGKYETAVNEFERALSLTGDENLKTRTYLLCARAHLEMDEVDSALEMLQQGYDNAGNSWKWRFLREMGKACVEYAQKNGVEKSEALLNKAIECYEILTDEELDSFQDNYNLVVCYEMIGKDTRAEKLLRFMEEDYPDEYRIPMRLSLLELKRQSELEEKQRDYKAAKDYYEKAKTLYKKAENEAVGDGDMQRLDELIDELYSKGWL